MSAARVKTGRVKSGLEHLLNQDAAELRGKRVGLVTHPAAVLPDLTGVLDALLGAGVQVTALFASEHGLVGAAADGALVGDGVDAHTGLPIYSLYGSTYEPTPAMLQDVDVVVFDMQDVGARFYTFLSTLFYVLKGTAQARKPVIVLDRPNPITGTHVEGPLVDPGCESFVGIAPIPIRHGLTLGELACYLNAECNLGAELNVVKMQGWERGMWFDGTDLPWVPTSPNMPHPSTTVVYPGMCLLEGTNLSVGRGTAIPFEICGASWLDGRALATQLNALATSGARFRLIQFRPTANRYAGELCEGIQVHVTEREALRPVSLGLQVIAAVRALAPTQFEWNAHFDRLMGSPRIREALDVGRAPADLIAEWAEVESAFADARAPYLLYA
jgi:uncharacterized protein YbbC (DUF1343 family)